MPNVPKFSKLSQQWFLTYPRLDSTPNAVLGALLGLPVHIVSYVIAREEHADGYPHYHVYLKLDKALRTNNCRYFDILGHHGKYEGCRSAKAVVGYITKEDNWLSNMDVKALLALSQKVTRCMIGELLISQSMTLPQVTEAHPEMIYSYDRLKNNLLMFFQDTLPPKPPLPTWIPNPWGLLLLSGRLAKRRHLWIWSRRPNFGKSYHFAKPLVRDYGCYLHSGGGTFVYWGSDLHAGTKCIILDEYNAAGLPFHELNTLCDGNGRFNRKYLSAVQLEEPLIIVLSNSPIEEIYPFKYELVKERFIEHELTVIPYF